MPLRLDKEFIKIIDQILIYILDYTEEYFKFEKLEKNSKVAGEFMKKSFEGLKLAQEEIIKNLLEIESKIKETKGKDKTLFFKEKIILELADSIAFLIFGGEWAHFKPFIHKNMNDGFLADRNVESCIDFARQVNKNPMQFAFINDLTSVMGFADITKVSLTKNNSYFLEHIEIKTGKKNAEIINLIHKEEDLSAFSSEKDLKQAERIIKEIHKISKFSKYRKSDLMEGDCNRRALDFQGEEKTYTNEVRESLGIASINKYKHIPTDFGIIQVCDGFGLAKEMDFKHFIYHMKNQNWKECDYIKKPKNIIKYTKENLTNMEPIIYCNLKIYTAIGNLAYPALEPLSMMFGREKTIDIISGKKSVYVFFDHEAFSQTLKKNGLKTKLVKAKYLLRNMHFGQASLRDAPTFEDKFMVIFNDEGEFLLTFGLLFKMVYKYLSAETIAGMFNQIIKSNKA